MLKPGDVCLQRINSRSKVNHLKPMIVRSASVRFCIALRHDERISVGVTS